MPKKNWPEDQTHIDRVWHEKNGDCRQEFVLIGQNMDKEALTAKLDACLLTDEEIESTPKKWKKQFTDHFPKWKLGLFS